VRNSLPQDRYGSLIRLVSLLLAGVPVDGGFVRDLFPGLLVFGPGLGACAVAGSIAALTGVGERESGVASGINTAAFQIGGAFGVAVVSSVAVSYTSGADRLAALTEGYRAAFTACVILAAAGTAVALVLVGRSRTSADQGQGQGRAKGTGRGRGRGRGAPRESVATPPTAPSRPARS
jgi:hypothetical protein